MADAEIKNLRVAERCRTVKSITFSIEIEIEYPIDMPDDVALDYARTPAGWIRNYALSQARGEQQQHEEHR